VARLEGAETGVSCSSGMGATLAALRTLLEPGQRLVASRNLYGLSTVLINTVFAPLGVDVTFVEGTDLSAWEAALAKRAHAVFLETISNPLLRVPDLAAIVALARQAGARVVADNTIATPYHFRPLSLGADLVVHSATKFLGGHNDVTAGVIVGDEWTMAAVRGHVSTLGVNLSPFEAWLALRGLTTLAVRLSRSSDSAASVAHYLESHPKVTAVHYPGLESHPQRVIADRLLGRGFGSMVSFEVSDGEPGVARLLRGFGLIKFATTLGGVATTIMHPAKTSHRSLTPEERCSQGIRGGLLWLSVGIESPEDIIADLGRGLEHV